MRSLERFEMILTVVGKQGGVESVERQTAYLHDRVMVSSTSNYRQTRDPFKTLVFINCTSPSFRFPDQAIRKGGVEVVKNYYPWAYSATTVFIGVPKPIQALFHMTKPIMGKLYDQFKFADSREDLLRYVSAENLPKDLGGEADWEIEKYIRKRIASERHRGR
mmetsp:Transcript_36855/g.71452  ORF Transcript_36855/g.71452 Transcript_36855/m.71452 type:complete len:163 (+) Transcript_36855:138-626(+)